ncbi:MAG: lytic murein transglycosylase [Hyphomicrobiales bacterium]|nr:lytic murein transglycosylase [Hyphomicrobiales bacterium]
MQYQYRKSVQFIVCLLLLCGYNPANAEETFQSWLETVKKQAIQQRIKSKKQLRKALKDVKYIEKVVALDKKQPEKTITFNDYRRNVIPASRKKKARALYRKHKTLLDKIAQKYGVQPRYIVALWGIESDFGNNMGGYYVPQALATLAYDGRRREFFTKELLYALKILDEGHIPPQGMKGSWAGAMGQCQFMPSSFISFATDYNGDGHRDIWGTLPDVFASIANYLSKSGWDNTATWGRRVHVPSTLNPSLVGVDKERTLAEWQKLGVRRENGTNLPLRNIKASLIMPDGEKEGAYLVYSNYKVLLRWNRSLFFATAVGELSDAIGG